MSRLDELITELCPDGVKFKNLSQVLTIKNGKDYKSFGEGDIPVYGTGGIMSYIDRAVYKKPSVLIPRKGSIDKLYYVDTPFWTVDTIFYTDIRTELIEPKYVFYYLQAQHLEKLNTAGGVPSLTQAVLNSVKIPLPPLPVQHEIVRLLDNFTELAAELIAQLTAELTIRKKQYEYYRDKMFMLTKTASMRTLGEIAIDMYRGSGIKRDQVTETGIPCVRYGEIYTTYNIWFDTCVSYTNEKDIKNKKYFEYGDILFAITGESVSEIAKSCVYVGHEKCLAGGDIVVMKHNENPKYIAYALSTTFAQMQKSKGKVKSKVVHSSIPALKSIEIPILQIEEQSHIVSILDRLNALVKEIEYCLPAEIKARRKQYEYYRDKLLTFREIIE